VGSLRYFHYSLADGLVTVVGHFATPTHAKYNSVVLVVLLKTFFTRAQIKLDLAVQGKSLSS
jgi:hypothetical protein